jgi:hypothetical protein
VQPAQAHRQQVFNEHRARFNNHAPTRNLADRSAKPADRSPTIIRNKTSWMVIGIMLSPCEVPLGFVHTGPGRPGPHIV